MRTKSSIITGFTIKSIAVISAVYGLFWSTRSLQSFSYFTTLSNIAIALVLAFFIGEDLKALKALKSGITYQTANYLYIIKYVFTVSITITFLVFLFLLAPTIPGGMWEAYFSEHAYSFFLHLLTPVLAIVDFFVSDHPYRSKNIHAVFAIFPAVVYALSVCFAGAAGYRWGTMYAPYNFLNFGAPTGWFGINLSLMGEETLGIGVAYMILALVLIFLVIGFIFLKLKDLVHHFSK